MENNPQGDLDPLEIKLQKFTRDIESPLHQTALPILLERRAAAGKAAEEAYLNDLNFREIVSALHEAGKPKRPGRPKKADATEDKQSSTEPQIQ